MKIAILQDDFPPEHAGGAGMVAAASARQLHARGHEVTVIAATSDPDAAGVSEWEGMQVYRLFSSYPERWRAWRSLYNPAVVGQIRRLLQELRPHIVHAHNVHYHLSYASLAAAKRTGAKVFLTVHDVMPVEYGQVTSPTSAWQQLREQKWRYNPFRNFLIRRAMRKLDGVFAVSDALACIVRRRGISITAVLHNAVDVAKWDIADDAVAAFAAAHGLAGKKVLFFGGRITPRKGGDVLAAALATVVRAVPEAVMFVAGKENQYLRTLQERVYDSGAGRAIVPAGWLAHEELKAAYHASHIVLQPSLCFESFGLIALEGMACGKPAVVSASGGLPEVVRDGETGYVVDPRDTDQLSAKLIELLLNPERARAMGEAGRRRARDFFSLERHTEKLLSWYEK